MLIFAEVHSQADETVREVRESTPAVQQDGWKIEFEDLIDLLIGKAGEPQFPHARPLGLLLVVDGDDSEAAPVRPQRPFQSDCNL